jgi:5-hydroxyisourate hydrolase-like protein (transthyretin family)
MYKRIGVWFLLLLLLLSIFTPVRLPAVYAQSVPTPSITADRSEVTVNQGDTFTVTFTARNLGGTPNDRGWSHVTISVSGGLEIVGWTRWSDRDKKVNIGDPIWHKDGRQIPAENEMLEAYASFPSGTTRVLTVTFRAKSPGSQWINFRFTLVHFTQDEDWYTAQYYRDPSSSSFTDQQGWPAKRINVMVQAPLPDLTVTSVTVSSVRVRVGEELTVSWVERNQGTGNAGAYNVGVYLGRTEYGKDYKLGQDYSSGLGAGGSRSRSLRFTIPNTVSPGLYYVTVFIDETDIVRESNENNNIGSTTPNRITVDPPPPPDLTVRDVVFSPQSVVQGGGLTVSWTEANIGSGNAGPYRVGVYLGVSEYGRDYLLGSLNRDGLSAGGSRGFTQTFTVPSSVPPGIYYVTVFIDSQGDVSESNEGNNVGSSTPNRVNVVQTNGNLAVQCLDVNGNPVPNVEVKLYKSDPWTYLRSQRADSNGRTTFTDLPQDLYYVTYVPPTPWRIRDVGIMEIGTGKQSVRVEAGRTVSWTVTEAGLTVYVRDQAGNPIQGVGVLLYIMEQNTYQRFLENSEKITDSDGKVVYRYLAPNSYYWNAYVVEVYREGRLIGSARTEVNSGWNSITVTVTIPVKAAQITFVNTGSKYLVQPWDYAVEPNEDVLIRLGVKNTGTTDLHLRVTLEIWDILQSNLVYSSSINRNDKEIWLSPGELSRVIEFSWTVPETPTTPAYVVYIALKDWDSPTVVYDSRGGSKGDAPILHVPYDNGKAVLVWFGTRPIVNSFVGENLEFWIRVVIPMAFTQILAKLGVEVIARFIIGRFFSFLIGLPVVGNPASIDAYGVDIHDNAIKNHLNVFESDIVPVVINLYTGDVADDIKITILKIQDTPRQLFYETIPLYRNEGVILGGSYIIYIKNLLFSEAGEYLIKTSYGDQESEIRVTVLPIARMYVQPVAWSDSVEVAKSKSQTFTISASGGTVKGVTVTKIFGPDWIIVSQASLGDIPDGSFKTFTVTASPPAGTTGSFDYLIRVSCTEGEPKSIDISGTITVAPISSVEVRTSNVRLIVGGDEFARIILSKAPAGLAGYELIVRLVPQAGVQQDVADIVDIRFPEWAGLTDKSIGDDLARFRAVDIGDRVRVGSEEIVLAEVVLRGKAEGTMRIELVVVRMDDDGGGSIPVTTRNGVLEVVRAGPPPVEENLPPPRDLDGDGLYEDLNGNGRLDYDDVVKFFRHFDDPVITQYSRYYDFNRNGRLDYDDIVELFKRVQ